MELLLVLAIIAAALFPVAWLSFRMNGPVYDQDAVNAYVEEHTEEWDSMLHKNQGGG